MKSKHVIGILLPALLLFSACEDQAVSHSTVQTFPLDNVFASRNVEVTIYKPAYFSKLEEYPVIYAYAGREASVSEYCHRLDSLIECQAIDPVVMACVTDQRKKIPSDQMDVYEILFSGKLINTVQDYFKEGGISADRSNRYMYGVYFMADAALRISMKHQSLYANYWCVGPMFSSMSQQPLLKEETNYFISWNAKDEVKVSFNYFPELVKDIEKRKGHVQTYVYPFNKDEGKMLADEFTRFASISLKKKNMTETNILLRTEWDTPHNTIPFDSITIDLFKPAILEAIKINRREIDNIVANPETPTFDNTVKALEFAGSLYGNICSIFNLYQSSVTSDRLEEIAEELTPAMTTLSNDIIQNETLFERVKYVYDHIPQGLDMEDLKLLDDTYNSFVRHGANLSPKRKMEYREVCEQLELATLKYDRNILRYTNSWFMHLTNPKSVEGMPDSVVEQAAEEAKSRNLDGWVFTLHAPSYVAFMTYCKDPELRRTMYMKYAATAYNDKEFDNQDLVRKIVNLKQRSVQILGYKNLAEYILPKRMAENTDNVYQLLNTLKDAYKPTALREVEELQEFAIEQNNPKYMLNAWDLAYYGELLKKSRYSLDMEEFRPYLKLDNVIRGVFGLATRLYGITFKRNQNIQVYDPDVRAYEVYDKDSKFLAILYADFFPRANKRSGAWMDLLSGQYMKDGKNVRPAVTINMNFTKPTQNKPSLLTMDEVGTFLHEFGHALHGIFSNVKYESECSPNVYWDFVELPSQFMENFLIEKDFLDTFAKHYITGETLPQSLLDKLIEARHYHAAYACLRQLSFGFIDMAWYTLEKPFEGNVRDFENEACSSVTLIEPVQGTCTSTHFSHIFSGGYSAGYYSYKWAEVLDADAFEHFKEHGIFSQEIAESFRKNILERGSVEDPMELYVRFRGSKPKIDALLHRDGLK